MRRIVKIRSSIVKRRTAVFQRLDAQLELLGPAWYDALGTRYGKATLALLARYDFAELAADIAIEAEQAQALTDQIDDLDERAANLYAEADPTGIITSAPGVGPVTAAVIAGRLGDPHRFHSLAAIRAYSGLVPKLSQSGQSQYQHGLTKAGDPLLREALFTAANTRQSQRLKGRTGRGQQESLSAPIHRPVTTTLEPVVSLP